MSLSRVQIQISKTPSSCVIITQGQSVPICIFHKVEKVKYLGNYLSSSGGVKDTIEERRKKGWGRVSQILGILGEVDMGGHRMEAGLLLRKAILTNSLLFSAEAWSNVTDKDIKRLEQVDHLQLNLSFR